MGTRPAKPSHLPDATRRLGWIITIASIAVVVAVAVLSTVPVPHKASFSFGGGNFGLPPSWFSTYYSQYLCPAGAEVAVAFSSAGLNVTFSIIAPNDTWSWTQHSAYANVSFAVSACGTYTIDVLGFGDGSYAIDGTLTYMSPLW